MHSAEIIEIDLNEIKEPILACPNDPDDVKLLSEVAGAKIDEVFIGSCMTNIGHYRAAAKILENQGAVPVRMWVTPPTKMDAHQLTVGGMYSIFGTAGARMEMLGCSLCMGNQARVADNTTVVSTSGCCSTPSTRNFPNRLGRGANVYLASAELAAVSAKLGKLPTVAEYMEFANKIAPMAANIYRYLNFHEIEEYKSVAQKVIPIAQAA
jgi:aconitate hydratase 2 / 2-methylisocitrate dehydratase